MARTDERVYRMTLAQFHRYLGDKRDELVACAKEVEEIQTEFRRIFEREVAAWQELFTYCYPRLLSERSEMPRAFADQIDRVESEEKARIRREMEELDQEIRQGRETMDEKIAGAQAATKALRVANPQLNDREEKLKAQVVKLQEEYTQAFEQQEVLEASTFGWLSHAFKIRRLAKLQKTIKKQQAHALAQLDKVRAEWLNTVKETGETQSALREEWEKVSVRASQAQGRRDHLEANFAELAEQAALKRLLEELREPPTVPGELGKKLAELVSHNKVRAAYEEGLGSVSEALGILKGMGDGLARFRQSVQQVLQEQKRYNLSKVDVGVPASVAAVNQIWAELRQRVKDEDYMATNPLEFSGIVVEYVSRRLTDETIKGFFEQMGQALDKATAAWG